MKKLLLICLFFYTNQLWSAETDKKPEFIFKMESDNLWKINFNLATGQGSDSFVVGFESPSFFNLGVDKLMTHYGLFADFQSITLRNSVIRKDKFQDIYNHAFNFGLASRTYIRDDFAIYGKLGASYLNVDSILSEKRKTWGAVMAVGLESLWTVPDWSGNFFNIKKSSMFAELSYLYNVNRADKFVGEPMYFNHLFIGLGVRSYI